MSPPAGQTCHDGTNTIVSPDYQEVLWASAIPTSAHRPEASVHRGAQPTSESAVEISAAVIITLFFISIRELI